MTESTAFIGAVYEVRNPYGYRGHRYETKFEAILEPDAEQRALDRGDIRVIERRIPSVRPGTFTLPEGWTKTYEEVE